MHKIRHGISLQKRLRSFGRLIQPDYLGALIAIAAVALFLCSAYRHLAFQSTAFDLGIYDQAIYLISQGLPPISSFLGFHILGDHASVIFYPIALLYKLYPSVYWLFGIQSLGLALGALPTYHLARLARIERSTALTLAAVYLLYPVIFNVNLFDFHAEVLAPAALLGAVWAARTDRIWLFTLLTLLVLSLKAPLALTVIAMGIWLLLFEQKPKAGLIAMLAGGLWFLWTTQWLMPVLSGSASRAIDRYDRFGNSPLEIALNLVLQPRLVAESLFTQENWHYLGRVFLPVAWGLSPLCLAPLIGALPTLIMNLVADFPAQKTLDIQYSLPIVPFLLLSLIAAVAAGRHWIRWIGLLFARLNARLNVKWLILIWAVLSFHLLARHSELAQLGRPAETIASLQRVVQSVDAAGSVLTDNQIAPHLTHRTEIRLACNRGNRINTLPWDYVVLSKQTAHLTGLPNCIPRLIARLRTHPQYQLDYENQDIYLFSRKPT